ncbi:MAG: 2-C-methyl-D-erythritol 2,4-cyclodiphosphate synthase [Nitrospirae bacterium]|nr:MAG: 2-C-methyl-D-erythritol 2,4-cyclodiphosphate synthase [Nitrospirota bacterium]
MRVGNGFDSHRFSKGVPLILGGVNIPHARGLLSHTDGDVVVHALIDAIIGAMGTGDIGTYFPDTDERHRGRSSLELLREVIQDVLRRGFRIEWADVTVIAEEPKIGPYRTDIMKNLVKSGLPEGRISIKAKTNEGMGFVGRGEGVAALATVLLGE